MAELARRPGPDRRVRVTDHGERHREREDRVVTEEPLEIRLEWPAGPARTVWTTLRTPGQDFELAAGWTYHEGLGEPERVAYCTDASLTREQELNTVTVTLAAAPTRDLPGRLDALSAGSAACGVCGTDRITEVLARTPAASEGVPRPDADVLRRLPDLMRPHQTLFSRTGGCHAAGLFTEDGALLTCREDVGRHNAVDKVTGARVLAGEPPAAAALVVSGRAGFELVQKAIAAGSGCLVAVGAPSGLAIDLARAAGLGLYGWTTTERTVRYA